jgi:hypothetical protein
VAASGKQQPHHQRHRRRCCVPHPDVLVVLRCPRRPHRSRPIPNEAAAYGGFGRAIAMGASSGIGDDIVNSIF